MDQARSGAPQAPRCPSPDSPDAGVLMLNWMSLLPVGAVARYVFALIYQYSADGAGCYAGGAVYAALRCGVSERSARRAIKELADKGFVRRVRPYVQGDSRHCLTLQVVLDRVGEFRRSWADRMEASGKGDYDGPVGVPAELTGVGNRTRAQEDMPCDQAPPHDILSGGRVESHDNLSGGHMTDCPVEVAAPHDNLSGGDVFPHDNLTGGDVFPHDNLTGGQNVHRSDCPVVKSAETQGQSAAHDNLSGDHMTDCHVIYKEGYIYPSNPSFPSGDVPADRDGLRVAEAILAASAVNRRGVDKIHEPLTALVAQGIGIDEIQAAWDRRQEDARKTVSSDRYMPNLAKWLAEEGPGGAWAMVAVERGRRRREAEGAPSPRPRMVELADGRGRVWGCVEATGAVVVLCDDDGAPIRADAEGSLDRARAKLAERVHERGMAG